MGKKKRVFVIMPFSKTIERHTEQYWTRHFNSYLKPVIERNENLEAFRSQPLRGDIANQIITDLVRSDIVVADLTDHNPNVLWELGVRQSFKQCTITIAEMDTQIPFHFSHKGVLFYNGEHLENEPFEQSFQNALENCVMVPDAPDSPVLETLGGRGSLYGLVRAEENTRKIQALRMELASNKADFAHICGNCEYNKKMRAETKRKKVRMFSALLRTSAMEHLYVNRYLDQGQEFYDTVQRYYASVLAINARLGDWADHQKSRERWFIKLKEKYDEVASKVEQYLEQTT